MLEGGDLVALASRLGRSADALRLHAQQLGLYRPPSRRRWERWEDATIRDGYTTALTCAEVARRLPHRTPGSVAARARKLGLSTYARRWSASDHQRLAWLCALDVPLEQVALQLAAPQKQFAAARHDGGWNHRPPWNRGARHSAGPKRRMSFSGCTPR